MVASIDRTVSRLVDFDGGKMNPEIFCDRDIYEQELEQIFARTWLFVGHTSQIPNLGDFIISRMGEEKVIVTRDRKNQVHVLLNSCRHRGNMVCRYDSGNAFGFQCTFHGWVYDSTGALVTLPKVDGGYDEMPKGDWGLISARVALFQGSIWACWDKDAPDFLDFLGGCEMYLKPPFCDSDGSDDGAEITGLMKWRIGMNWKVPMPDNDSTHGWITHRSIAVAMGRGAGGGQTQQNADPSDLGSSFRSTMQVAFPEGHTTALRVPSDKDAESHWRDNGMYDDWPAIKEYFREKHELRKKNLGKFAYLDEGPHVFPNMGWFGRVIRILHPQGPAETEMWSYFLVDKAAPPEVKEGMARYYEHWYGPGGMTQKDDMENWYNLTQASKGHMTRKMNLNMQLRLSDDIIHGPSKFGLPGLWAHTLSDWNTRMFYKRWGEMMVSDDWNSMRVESAK